MEGNDASFKHLGIDPFAYLREALPGLFALECQSQAGELLEWLPDRWLLRRGQDMRLGVSYSSEQSRVIADPNVPAGPGGTSGESTLHKCRNSPEEPAGT